VRNLLRVASGPIVIGLLMLLSLTAGAGASGPQPLLPNSPLSGGALMAQAIHTGTVRLAGQSAASASFNPNGVLGNVQASEGGQPVNEDPIAANPKNSSQLLTGGNDYNCASLQGFYTTSNGGKTWTHTCMNTESNNPFGCGDPGVGYDLNNTAYITGIDAASSSCVPGVIAFEKSTNNGSTWSAPATAVNPLFSGGLTDKPWLQVDDNPSSPHANALYISVTQFDSTLLNTEISVSHSTDGGNTWTTKAVDTEQFYPNIDQFSDLAIGKDGTVYVSWMRCTAGSSGECAGTQATLEFSKSTDGGNTWSAPVTIAKVMLAPDPYGCCFYGTLPNTHERVSEIPALDIDNSTGAHAGNLYAVMYNWTGSYMAVEVATSTNGGSTWGAPVRVTPTSDTHDQFFPWLTVSPTGIVGVSWLDRRNDPSNLSYETFISGSTNGGTSFVTNIQLATKPSNPLNDGFGGGFMGDYTGDIWDSSTVFAASWMDSRNGVDMQDWVGGYSTK